MLTLGDLEIMLFTAREHPDGMRVYRPSGAALVEYAGFAVPTLKMRYIASDVDMLISLSGIAEFFAASDAAGTVIGVSRGHESYIFQEYEHIASMGAAGYRAMALGYDTAYSVQLQTWLRIQ